MANTLRTFVALPVPDAVAGFLKQVQDRLRASVANIRWVSTANVHLTLKFLGDIEPAMVPMIVSQLDAAARSMPPFSLIAKGAGVFPNLRQARVLWVGLNGDLKQLDVLQQDLETRLATLGFKCERRPFRAHLTIGRTRRRPDSKTLGVLLEPLKAEASEPFGVHEIRFYQSVLKPAGAEYTLLHTASLGANGAMGR
jgi:RNA 2',3'-cyclic 3'-phosphodiesterase